MVFYLVSTFNANSIDKVDIGVKMHSYPKENRKNQAFIYNNC